MTDSSQWQRLNALHHQIAAIDSEIAHLFQERLLLAEEAERRSLELEAEPQPQAVIQPMAGFHYETGELPPTARVACQGVEGAFSHQAADHFFQDPEVLFRPQFEEVFQAVAAQQVDYGVLPIENSTAGSVGAVYDLMRKYHFYIVKEAKVPVSHCLLAKPGTRLEEVREIYSHQQALSQCEGYLTAQPKFTPHAYSNTAAAAKYIAQEGEPHQAAIASRKCAAMYGLEILAEDIQDISHNTTRFICISREPVFSAQANKLSLCLTLQHKPGSLYHLLNKFAINQMNLTKLESRPWPERNFEFMFYLDVEGNLGDLKTRLLLEDLNNQLGYFKILGSYNEA